MRKEGEEEMEKKCVRCKQTKSINEFSANKIMKDGKNSYCKECMNGYMKRYYSTHRTERLRWMNEYNRARREERGVV